VPRRRPPRLRAREQLLAGIADAGIRAALEGLLPAAAVSAPAPAAAAVVPTAERSAVLTSAEVLELQDQARSLGVEASVRTLLADSTSTRAAISDAMLAAVAARQAGGGNRIPAGSGARVGDEREGMTSGVRDAILHGLRRTSRVDDVPENARQFMRYSLSEMAATVLGERTLPRSAGERVEVFERAFHTTSDFPALLGGALNARLSENYQAASPVYREIASQMTFADFRPHSVIRPGDFPNCRRSASRVKSSSAPSATRPNRSRWGPMASSSACRAS